MPIWVDDHHSQGSAAESRRQVQRHGLSQGAVKELDVLIGVQVGEVVYL